MEASVLIDFPIPFGTPSPPLPKGVKGMGEIGDIVAPLSSGGQVQNFLGIVGTRSAHQQEPMCGHVWEIPAAITRTSSSEPQMLGQSGHSVTLV